MAILNSTADIAIYKMFSIGAIKKPGELMIQTHNFSSLYMYLILDFKKQLGATLPVSPEAHPFEKHIKSLVVPLYAFCN